MKREIDKLEILKKMIKIRMVELYIAKLYPEQKMKCPTHLCLGQEAVPAVFGYFANKKDIFVGTCRSHGHYLAKGGDLTALFSELLGKPTGCSKGFGGSMHIIDVENNFWGTSAIVAGGIPIAAGAAFSFKYKKLPYVVVCFFGDAAVEEGVVYETINFSLLHNLPIVFVCENNRLAITTPIELRQCTTTIFNRFDTMGIRSFCIEENDIDSLINIAQKSYDFARKGFGPSFIEYKVSRWSVHVGPDFEGPVDAWWQDMDNLHKYSCPICKLISQLLDKKAIDFQYIQNLRKQIINDIEQSYKKAEKAENFFEEDLSKFVYSSSLRSDLPKFSGEIASSQFKVEEVSKLVNPF